MSLRKRCELSWKEVLIDIQEHAPRCYHEDKSLKVCCDRHPLARKLGTNGKHLESCIRYLERMGLVQRLRVKGADGYMPDQWDICLTREGFDVACMIQGQMALARVHHGLVFFSGIIVLTGAAQLIYEISEPSGMNPWIFLFVYVALAALLFGTFLQKNQSK